MYQSGLQNLRDFEGVPLRKTLRSPELSGKFSDYTSSYVISVDILRVLIGDIENNSQVDANTFRYQLFKAFFELGLDTESLKTYVSVLFGGVYEYITTKPRYSVDFLNLLNRYEGVILSTIDETSYTNKGYSLSGVEEYKTAKSNSRISVLTKNTLTRTVQTLFPYTRYWYPPDQRLLGSYSPLQLNKNSFGFSPISKNKDVLKLSYEPSLVYEGRVWLRKPNTKPSEDKFIESEWDLFLSKRFNSSKSFNTVYSSLLEGVYLSISENSQLINSVTSDSKVEVFKPKYDQVLSDKDLLVNSFGGSGRAIYEKLIELRYLSEYLGGYEGSPVGSISYVSEFTEYLDFMTSGKLSSKLKQDNYGKFNSIFPTSSDSIGAEGINGLKFLEKFSPLRSFSHNQIIPTKVDLSLDRISYNPLLAKFSTQVSVNREIRIYKAREEEVDFIDHSLNVLLQRSVFLGDKLDRIASSLNKYGQLHRFENLGSLSFQMSEFQKSFPPVNKKGGFTGAIGYLYESYRNLSTLSTIPYDLFSNTLRWLKVVLKSLEDVKYELENLGIRTNGTGYLPNIETKKFVSSTPDMVKYLSFLGFRDSEINQVLSIESFPDFISKFAPLSDSSDLNSFFKGFELSQLIYEFAGQKGIDAYLEFLYKRSSVGGLLNVLALTEKDKSDQTFSRISKYPKLIALLLGLSYAIDPDQLNEFSYLLGDNKVSLLDSISYLLQNNQDTIIKRKEDISLLDGVISQLVGGYYSGDPYSSTDIDYDGVTDTSPIGLNSWTELINKSLGNVPDPRKLSNIYDKSIGLSLKELITILNNPTPNSGVGQVIDSFYGGNFTKILRYANISGLATKLGYYKNSSQLNNVKLDFDETYSGLPSVIEALDKVIQSTNVTIKLIQSSINSDWADSYYEKPNLTQTLINSQNKPVEAMVGVISGQFTKNPTTLNNEISSLPPIAPPGIGNSSLPNRVSVPNSLTPEQARTLSSSTSVSTPEMVVDFSAKNLLNKFIKVTERNLVLNNISTAKDSSSIYGGRETFGNLSDTSRKETVSDLSNEDITLYRELRSQNLNNSGSGKNFITSPEQKYEKEVLNKLPKDLLSDFDPKESCKRFGGSNCDSLYDSPRCAGVLNKSYYPETYSLDPFNNGVVVDRPLGYFSEYLPSDGDIINNKTPSYYSLLDSPLPGRGTEAIMKDVSAEPMVMTDYQESGDMVDYANTQLAISEFTKYSKKEHTELTCASLPQPHLYQICMNLLKCKRFKVRNDGKDTGLRFCPPGTSGGRRMGK